MPDGAGLLQLFWHVGLAPEPAHEVVAQVFLTVAPQLGHSGVLAPLRFSAAFVFLSPPVCA